MGKKTERHVWDWARLPDVAASFDRAYPGVVQRAQQTLNGPHQASPHPTSACVR